MSRPCFQCWLCRAVAPWGARHSAGRGCAAPGSPSGYSAPHPQGTGLALLCHPGHIAEDSASFAVHMKMWQLQHGSLVPQLSRGGRVALWSGPPHLPITAFPGICLATICSVVLHPLPRLQCVLGKASCMLTRTIEGFNGKHLSLSSWYIFQLCWAIYWA